MPAVTLRGEAFNVVNHTNWQSVGTTPTTASTFGQVRNTAIPASCRLPESSPS